jgi:hypothetical protein
MIPEMKIEHVQQFHGLREDKDLIRAILSPLIEK